jgi:hypothetical protein
MPILFVVRRSRPRLFAALRRLVSRPGLVGVMLERREPPARAARPADGAEPPRRPVRQPLDHDGIRTLAEVGFAVMSVRLLPEAADSRRARPAAPATSRPARRSRARARPARRRSAPARRSR